MSNRLQVGIDFSQKSADFGLFFPDGQPLDPHQAFDNSLTGYSLANITTKSTITTKSSVLVLTRYDPL